MKTTVSELFWMALFILFLALKLTEEITWSWWWVTAPLWGPWAVFAVGWLVWFLVGLFCELMADLCDRIYGRGQYFRSPSKRDPLLRKPKRQGRARFTRGGF